MNDESLNKSTRRLEGKVALIVGGGTSGPARPGETVAMGNGRATSILCAREGAAVVVADISGDLANETVELIHAEGGRAEAIEVDASDSAGCRAAVDAAVASFGGLHLLVNALGIVDGQTIADVDVDTFDRCYQVNLRSNLLTMKYASVEMAKAGGGAIVNVSSIAALRSGAGIGYDSPSLGSSPTSRIRPTADSAPDIWLCMPKSRDAWSSASHPHA